MYLQSLGGLFILTGIAWLFSEHRRYVRLRTIVVGLALQLFLAALLLKLAIFQEAFLTLNRVIQSLEEATRAGTSFVFGFLGGGPVPFQETSPEHSFVLAFRALPLVLVMSALSSVLFYWGLLPLVVKAFSRVLQRSMGIGGAVGVGAAANIFVGMVEAPLLVRPYLNSMTRSELFVIMTCGMATVAGTMMALYASILGPVIPDAIGHILTASLISAPAAIMVAQIMVPERDEPTAHAFSLPHPAHSTMDAITQGTLDGVKLLLNIIALLIVLVALVNLVNQLLGVLPEVGGHTLTLQGLLGYLMAPIAWLMGVPWEEARTGGTLLGIKTVLNEFLAYLELAQLPEESLSPRSRLIMTYALCGFANFGSLGIMLGGLGTMVPERREEIIALGLKSIVAGTLATCLTGAVVGLLLWTG